MLSFLFTYCSSFSLFCLGVLTGVFGGGSRSAEFLHIMKEITCLLQEIIWESEQTSCFKSLYSTCTLRNLAWWSGRPCEAPGVSWGLKFINSRLCPNIPLSRNRVHMPLSPLVPLHNYCRYYTKMISSGSWPNSHFPLYLDVHYQQEFSTSNPNRRKVHPMSILHLLIFAHHMAPKFRFVVYKGECHVSSYCPCSLDP